MYSARKIYIPFCIKFILHMRVQFSSCTDNYQTREELHDYIKQPTLQAAVNSKKAIK